MQPFEKTLEKYWRLTLQNRQQRDWKTKAWSISESSLRNYLRQYVPEKMRCADQKNIARAETRLKLGKRICSAAVMLAACIGPNDGLYPEDPEAVMPQLIFNTNDKSLDLNPIMKTATARVVKGTKKALS